MQGVVQHFNTMNRNAGDASAPTHLNTAPAPTDIWHVFNIIFRNKIMNELYEELKELLKQEKGVALATVVGGGRGEEQVGANMLVYPNKQTHGTLGNAALDALVIEDAQQAIWVGAARTLTYSVER